MNAIIFGSGVLALLIGIVLRSYLVLREHQLRRGHERLGELRRLAVDLHESVLPTGVHRQLEFVTSLVGTGLLTKKLFRALRRGRMDTPELRQAVEQRRESWAGASQADRVAFIQVIYTAILADSYYAGIIGTVVRRALFFVNNETAEIAKAMDAMETRLLIVGTLDVAEQCARKAHVPGACVPA